MYPPERSLASIAGELLRSRSMSLAIAESCTGGLVSHLITNIPGSSGYFYGGIVAYANEVKTHLLGVATATLDAYGAVSKETALEMARGIKHTLGADIGLSVTGIAGPGSDSTDKPVGLVWIGMSTPDGEEARQYIWDGDRIANKVQSAEQALTCLVDYLKGEAAETLTQPPPEQSTV